MVLLSEKIKKATQRPSKNGKYREIRSDQMTRAYFSSYIPKNTDAWCERVTYRQIVIYGGMQRISSFTIRFLGWMI